MLRVYTRFNLLNNFPQILLYSTSSFSSSSSSSSSSSNKSSSTNKISEYLVNSLRFSQQQAVTTSTKLSTCKNVDFSNLSKNAASVVDLLKNQGFNDTHITKMVSIYPKLLTYDAHSTIKPKLSSLIDEGISGIDLIDIVTAKPKMLGCISGSIVLPVIQVLKEILVVDAHVISALKKLQFRSFYSVCNYLRPNVALLTSCGVSSELIRKHVVKHPLAYLRKPDGFKDIVVKVKKKLQYPPNSAMFLYGIHLFASLSEERIESKCRMFKCFGWTQNDVDTLMAKNPSSFWKSAENLEKKLKFLMNDVGLEPAHLASNCCFFTCSLEKRLLPRHAVLKVLKDEALREKVPRLICVLRLSDSHFVERFVVPFEEVHQVYADHIGCTVKSLTKQ